MCVWKALAGIESHCLQLVRPPLLPSAAVRKSNAPLFPPLNFCHSPLIMSSALKRNEELGRKYHIRAETPRTSLVFGDFGHTAAAVVFTGPRVAEVFPGSGSSVAQPEQPLMEDV